MVDTCCDPTPIDFVIPANDDASKSIALIVDLMAKSIQEGLDERKNEKDKEPTSTDEGETEARPTRTRARKTAKPQTPKAEKVDGDKKVEKAKEEKSEEATEE
jgi:small subunit ribosomal protein S2